MTRVQNKRRVNRRKACEFAAEERMRLERGELIRFVRRRRSLQSCSVRERIFSYLTPELTHLRIAVVVRFPFPLPPSPPRTSPLPATTFLHPASSVQQPKGITSTMEMTLLLWGK